ncbi:nucleotidyltransferase family protein [Paracoccus ravus]|uniref:nucleotidyltransferase family protein n=1 Tax=Paracoccus ravus TaxID=2447760 RepID=UPI001430CA16|nr:nucleotidyltransferase family protein [Paracoccus ravus]
MIQIPPELRQDCTAEILALLGQNPLSESDPIRLFHVARCNKLLHLLPINDPALRPIRADLLRAQIATAQMNRRAIDLACETSHALAALGVRHLVLKGPFQQIRLHGTGHLRPSGDVDLYVSPRQRKAAAEAILAAGFAVVEPEKARWWLAFMGEQHFRRAKDGAMIDLHHRLHQFGLPGWRHAEAILDRAEPVMPEVIPVAGDADGCLLLAISIAKSLLAKEPCGWAVRDLAIWLGKLSAEDLARLWHIAKEAGQRRVLELSLRLVDAVTAASPRVETGSGLRGLNASDLRDLVYQPWRLSPETSPRRRQLLTSLGRGRPGSVMAQAVLSGLSPFVLGWQTEGARTLFRRARDR